jgi:DNA-directed RNA polymerase sigma subunit (sigma70/sigma32)
MTSPVRERFWEGKTLGQLGAARGVSKQAVRQQREAVLSKLREKLSGK